jgi:hypothetical protein
MTLSVLCSYVDSRNFNAGRPAALPEGSHLMLDSGGFSAWSRGEPVTLPELARWYASVPAELYVGLDVIYDPEATRRNALEMRDLGVETMPAVHAGTDPAEVDRLAKHGFTSVALGGLVNRHNRTTDVDAWAHACLDRADAHGMRKHGLGLTPAASRLALTLRFDSIDSTTWNVGRYRNVPMWDGERLACLDYNRDRLLIATILRRWPRTVHAAGDKRHEPVDWVIADALARRRGTPAAQRGTGTTRLLHVIGGVSMLAYGEWLMARGGPRIFLAGYLTTFTWDWDAEFDRVLVAVTERIAA